MKKIVVALMLATPIALTGCGSDTENTYIVNPPASSQIAPNSAVIVQPGSTVTKVCPAGSSSC
jgi:uncharacterized lipoprotein NlpE involved in copper resistance